MKSVEIEQIIAKWFVKKRLHLGLDIVTLSTKSNVTIGAISKIENHLSSVTLLSGVSLCFGLDETPYSFIEETELLPPEKFSNLVQFDILPEYLDEKVFSIADTEGYLRSIGHDDLSVEERLISFLLPAICAKEGCSQENGKLEAENLIRKAIQISFAENTPLAYPKEISLIDLLTTFETRSIMLFSDAGAFLRLVRNQNNFTLLQLQELAGVSKSSINRLELGIVERVKLAEIIALDIALSTGGLLTAIYWHVALCHFGIARNYFYRIPQLPPLAYEDMDRALLDTLVKIFRWRQAYSTDGGSFVREVRKIAWVYIESDIQEYPPTDEKLPLQSGLVSLEARYALAYTTTSVLEPYFYDLTRSNKRSVPADILKIWNLVVDKFSTDPFTRQTMNDLTENLADKDFRAAFRAQLKKAFLNDIEFAKQVQLILRDVFGK